MPPGWDPPRNATGESADIVVTGFRQEVTATVAIGTWSGLALRRVCCQRWCVPHNTTDMGLYRWQGDLSPLADKDTLDGAVLYVEGVAPGSVWRPVVFTLLEARPSTGGRSACSSQLRPTALAIASLLQCLHTHVHSLSQGPHTRRPHDTDVETPVMLLRYGAARA